MSKKFFEAPHLFFVRHGEPEYYTQSLSQPGKFDAKDSAKKLARDPAASIGRIMILSSDIKYDRLTADIIGEAINTTHPESELAVVRDARLNKLEQSPGSKDELHRTLGNLLLDHAVMPETQQAPDTVILVTDAPLMAVADGRQAYELKAYAYGDAGMIVDHTGEWLAPQLRLTA